MPTPVFNICQDSTATWATYTATWMIDKTDDGPAVPEAGVDEFVGAVWPNGVDEAMTQLNEACQGERFVDAWAVNAVISGAHADADNACVGTTATANNGITIRGTGLCSLIAADAGSNQAGRFQYDNSGTPQWEVWVEGTEVAGFAAAAVTFAAATTTVSNSNAVVIVGDYGGSPGIYGRKSDGGSFGLYLQQGGASRGVVTLPSDEILYLRHQDAVEAVDGELAIAAALATFSSATVCLTSGGLRTGYRDLAANAALTLAASDSGGTVVVRSTDTSTVAATMTALGAGSIIEVWLVECTSTGSYTFACTYGTAAGTLTLTNQHEGGRFQYTGSVWRLLEPKGGATFA